MKFESHREEVVLALKKAEEKGLRGAAIEIAGEARRRTPVDTGRLRASLAWAASGQRYHKGTATGRDGEKVTVSYAAEAPEGSARVGTNVDYGVKVHEDLDAFHPTGEAKFIENAFIEKRERAELIVRLALEGKL